jgi:1-acyl-sn-glycerol-3-phosphate acyltransferase
LKNVLYYLIKIFIRFGFFCYYQKIQWDGLNTLPKDRPILLLPNHQNALLDALLIAAHSPGKPYFLTRSDVFANSFFNALFGLLRMLPIYRIRDGRENLSKNQAIFDRCSELLYANETILIFPEANHNIERRLRPLSKGFTRILFNTLESYPGIDIRLVPVGINYISASEFPDSVAYYFGNDIPFSEFIIDADRTIIIKNIRERVADEIKKLTTHIGNVDTYEATIAHLNALGVNYLEPKVVNELVGNLPFDLIKRPPKQPSLVLKIWELLFSILNLPMVLIWKLIEKYLVPEIEFKSTYRFLFVLLFYPIFYLLLFILVYSLTSLGAACLVIGLHFLLNLVYVKFKRPQ